MVNPPGEDRPARPDAASPERGAPLGRRVVLGLLGLGAVGIVTGSAIQKGLAPVLGPIQNHDPTGLTTLLPLGDTFRFYSITGSVPDRDAQSYRLDISGLVRNPVSLTLADLQAMPQTSLTRDFQCVTGWRVLQVPWVGVRLSDLLTRAGIEASGTAVRFSCFDGSYSESLTLDQARRDDVLIALQMLGKPVTHDHGGPVRLFVGPMYGYKSAKWLSGIEVTAGVQPGYWEDHGYDIDGWVGRSNGREDDPTS